MKIPFVKSSFSGNGGCVEVGYLPNGTVIVRDSKDPEKEPHHFSRESWRTFMLEVKNGDFDLEEDAEKEFWEAHYTAADQEKSP